MRWVKWALTALILLSILIVLLPALLFAFGEPVHFFPQDGIWYCEELQLQISFSDDDETFTYADGEKVYCSCDYDRGSAWLGLHCRNYYSKSYQVGDVVFDGEYVSLDEQTLVIYDQETDQNYTFLRLPDT